IDFEGVNYPDKILRIMTTDDLGKLMPGLESITYLFNAGKSVSFLRMPDCWRIILRVPEAVDEKTATSIEWITDRLREVLPSWTTPPGIVDLDIYSVSRRIASRYREGRVFLAGDSAHVTNTRGGMNMNCGIHDSYEIANALVAALKAGRPDLVEAAADERLRVAREMLIPRTDRNITGGVAWLDKIKAMAASPSESTEYLATAAMLDMVTRPLRVA
ncbi:MAG: FAD-dependent monooxygenase, partial [Flavobacteriaceae bacterium]